MPNSKLALAQINVCRWKTEEFAAGNPVIVSKGLPAGRHTVVQVLECGQKKYFYNPTTFFYHTKEQVFYQGKCVGPINCPATHSKIGFEGRGRVCGKPGACTVQDGVGTTTIQTLDEDGVVHDTGLPCVCPRGVYTCHWLANNTHTTNKNDMSAVENLLCNNGLSLQPGSNECKPGCPPPFVARPMSNGSWCMRPGAAVGSVSITDANGTVLMSGPMFEEETVVSSTSRDHGSIWWIAGGAVMAIAAAVFTMLRHHRESQKHVDRVTSTDTLEPSSGAVVFPRPFLAVEEF